MAKHLVGIFGGAVSGAEAAFQCAEKGITTVVFDQNALPYGKIEDGLPKWHVKLRDKEEGRINEKLSHPLVHFVPNTGLGRDLDFEEVAREWGFSAVILAIGAWRDRPLPVSGAEAYVGKGLYYQNPFIHWYNHCHEPEYDGPQYPIADGVGIIGGGLASLDVAKVLMFETVMAALKERGFETDLFKLDRSIARVLEELGVTLDDLGIKGCTLYYRRRAKDMPLSPMVADTPEKVAKLEAVREKILNNYQSKYLFNVATQHVPCDLIVEDGHLRGLVFQETEIVDGRARAIPGTEEEVFAPYFVSSIGSIPEMIPGIPARGSVYDVADPEVCRLAGYEHVFAVGNAVTGRGNINESLKHGREVTQQILERYLDDPMGTAVEVSVADQKEQVARAIDGILPAVKPVSDDTFNELMTRVKAMQEKHGYNGDFMAWVQQHLPTRLEDLLGGH
ncbi:MAG: hypothetical protein R3301_13625 [Saprospiraceae bacterium]|nr:hypothetical protein [Saprospiraceae bacterium]